MLHIHFGNRIERLADALAAALSVAPPADPLVPETIVVGHAGMDEWLKRAIAGRLGIAANVEFPQPAAFVWRMLRAHDPKLPDRSPLDRGPIVWRLYHALGQADQAKQVADYLRGKDGLARFELAEALATVFEQYQIYRPEWIHAWEAGRSAVEGDDWQSALWRRVANGVKQHPARLYQEFITHTDALAPDKPPVRISVFGISALAPEYLKLLVAASGNRDVDLYVPNPSQAYWGDIESEKLLAKWQLTDPKRAEYATSGHPLLAALGSQIRDFIEILHDIPEEAGNVRSQTWDHFEPAGGESLLARLQNDILELVETPQRLAPDPEDDSILIHVCHSRRREVEVLHDALLAAFEADPELGPEDILVMAPNMDDYAEHIAAVFGAAPPERHIPWSLSERSLRAEHPLAEALLALLALPESRLKASEVLGLLDLPAVARRLELDEQGLESLHRWVGDSGIRWGYDAAHREQLNLPGEAAFTWRFGIDRLLAGYALAPDDDAPWDGIAPWGALEGQSARALGPLCEFVAQLESWRQSLAADRTFVDWAAAMRELLDLFAPESPDELHVMTMLREAIHELEIQAQLADFGEAVPLPVVRAALASRLGVPHHPRPFLSGEVTFCALAPMRSIPAKLVWLLGMSEDDFPRRGRAPGFDLIAADQRRGDRARRTEDRALFLDALLSARGAFHASYVGRSERDNGELPASVVVNTLREVLGRMGADKGDIVIAHPLQPFSASYQAEPRRGASYARHWLGARDPAAAPVPFAAPLANNAVESLSGSTQIAESIIDIALDDLIAGLCNPARRYLKALGIAHRRPDAAAEDDELFTLNKLDEWRVKDALLARWLETGADFDPDDSFAEFAARGWLPTGTAGQTLYAGCVAETSALVGALFSCVGKQKPAPKDVDRSVGAWHLSGRIADVYPGEGLVCARAGSLRAKDRIGVWIRHLALGTTGEPPAESRFFFVEKGQIKTLRLASVADPAVHLQQLCELYAASGREPLPLLPDLSFDYIHRLHGRTPDRALPEVRSYWRRWTEGAPNTHVYDGEDFALAFRGVEEPFDEHFARVAQEVFGPIAQAEGTP
ncbi:MAG TPA: exodeoxyribonuclease V subunit gamma [Gammaproteobacteria bacterium]|nr:exodeoxyribonuclease V subunit gamma [Gammaproteobacteria bacterium]